MADGWDACSARMATALTAWEPAARPIRVAVVDDHPVVREGTAALLAAQTGLLVVGTASSLDEAGELLAGTAIDVLLLDIRLGSDSGLRLLAADNPDRPLPAVVVVTAYDYPQYADAALRLGAAGFVLKTAPIRELVGAIERAASGGLAFGVRPRGGLDRLSAREFEVVRLVVDGRSNDEIGGALGIGSKTVETHLRRLFERFGIASRTELATRALREGWLEVPPAS
jgi:DNA-binding NarL/FixJ family response regulator